MAGATFHVIDLPICGGRVWCHTRLTHDEAGRIDDANIDMIPENLSFEDVKKLQALVTKARPGNIVELPKSLLAVAKDASRRQRQYDETLVDVVVHHMADVRNRDGLEIADKAQLGALDDDDWKALVAGAKAAVELGRVDPRSGSPTSSAGQSPTDAPASQQLRPAI